MDINRIETIPPVEHAAVQANDRAATGPKIYRNYDDARWMGGWRSNCERSPLRSLLHRDMPREQAEAEGYRPVRRAGLSAYVLVATCFDRGYIGRASKTYYSVWGK